MAAEESAGLTRVVLADDHEPTMFLLRTLLEFVPTVQVVGTAANGREAVDLVLSHQADVALLDIEMPLMDGFTAAELIGSQRPSARIILHTAYADSIKRAKAQALGLPLLIKGSFEETVGAVALTFDEVKKGARGPKALEGIVLSALAAGAGPAMVVVKADGVIPFYTSGAAELRRNCSIYPCRPRRQRLPGWEPATHSLTGKDSRFRTTRIRSRRRLPLRRQLRASSHSCWQAARSAPTGSTLFRSSTLMGHSSVSRRT